MPEITKNPAFPINISSEAGEQSLSGFREKITGYVEGYEQWAETHPFMATAAESVAAFAAKRAVIWTGKKIGVNFGNAHAHHFVDRGEVNPVAMAAELIVRAPVTEELFFRKFLTNAVPDSKVVKETLGDNAQRICNIVSSVGFAFLGHGFDPIRRRSDWLAPEKSLYSRDNAKSAVAPIREWQWAIPLGSMIGAEQYRRMYQKRGLKHAIGSHALNNALTLAWEGTHAARDFRQKNPSEKLSVRKVARSAQAGKNRR